VPTTAVALAASSLLVPPVRLHAEAPMEQTVCPRNIFLRESIFSHLLQLIRKPIYTESPSRSHIVESEPPLSIPDTTHPTPIDRLATEVRRCRTFIHANGKAAEERVNQLMSAFLTQEQNFTSTIASLAPPPQTGERLLPGVLYVLVASMAGSIISGNRNILLRATTPAAVGIGAAYVVLPHTMNNVRGLMWSFEEKSEFVAVNHLRIRGAAMEGWKQAKIRYERTREWSEDVVRDGRLLVEGWVRKGQ